MSRHTFGVLHRFGQETLKAQKNVRLEDRDMVADPLMANQLLCMRYCGGFAFSRFAATLSSPLYIALCL